MGLGKTLQVIGFLLSYFRYGLGTTALIVCPTTVVHNWSNEFQKWLRPETLNEFRQFHVIDRTQKTWSDRTRLLRDWMRQGGILIVGYSMYRRILLRTLETVPAGLLGREPVYQALVDPGPSVVICDEGHVIKNPRTALSRLLKTMKTRRRICLTGYPLQNNLIEYWCMVSWEFMGSVNTILKMGEKRYILHRSSFFFLDGAETS